MKKLDRSVSEEFVETLKEGTNGVLRIGQYLWIIQQWCKEEKNIDDIFNLENHQLVKLMKEYNSTRFDAGNWVLINEN